MARDLLERLNEKVAKVNAGQCWHHIFDWGDVLNLLAEVGRLRNEMGEAIDAAIDRGGRVGYKLALDDIEQAVEGLRPNAEPVSSEEKHRCGVCNGFPYHQLCRACGKTPAQAAEDRAASSEDRPKNEGEPHDD